MQTRFSFNAILIQTRFLFNATLMQTRFSFNATLMQTRNLKRNSNSTRYRSIATLIKNRDAHDDWIWMMGLHAIGQTTQHTITTYTKTSTMTK